MTRNLPKPSKLLNSSALPVNLLKVLLALLFLIAMLATFILSIWLWGNKAPIL